LLLPPEDWRQEGTPVGPAMSQDYAMTDAMQEQEVTRLSPSDTVIIVAYHLPIIVT